MADVEDLMFTRVTTTAGVSAIVSTRMYPGEAPSAAVVPYLVYRRIAADRPQAFGSAPGNVRATFEVVSVESTPKLARTLAAAVRAALHRWRDATGPPVVEDVFLEAEDEPLVDGKDKRFEIVQDYMVFYRE